MSFTALVGMKTDRNLVGLKLSRRKARKNSLSGRARLPMGARELSLMREAAAVSGGFHPSLNVTNSTAGGGLKTSGPFEQRRAAAAR